MLSDMLFVGVNRRFGRRMYGHTFAEGT